ncbi:hypothetical protein BH24ACI5_BH24ACI5_27150 [soil metagenome]
MLGRPRMEQLRHAVLLSQSGRPYTHSTRPSAGGAMMRALATTF